MNNQTISCVRRILSVFVCFSFLSNALVIAHAETEENATHMEDLNTMTIANKADDAFRCDRYFPPFFQEDYPNVLYGSGTVSDNGCSITAMAIVATFLTGHEYYPDELARYFGGKAENNIARLEIAADALQLNWERAINFDHVQEALRNGKIVIQLVNSRSMFTGSQHFIILTGITNDDHIKVIDPSSHNKNNWYMEQAFENGFTIADILTGYDGAWIFTPNYDPQNTFVYFEEPLDTSNPRYPDIQLNKEEIELLAKLVWVEARGECADGQQAVAEIVLNRMAAADFPNDLHSVVFAQEQFVTKQFDKAEPFQAIYDAIDHAIYGPYVLPTDVVFYARKPHNSNIWGAIGGHIFCYRAE